MAPDLAQVGDIIDIRRVITAFQRRLPLFSAIFVCIFLAAVMATLRATPMYTATSSIMLDPRQSQVVNVEAVVSGMPADSPSVDSQVEVIKSRQLAERVVTALKLEQDPEFNSALRKPTGLAALKQGVKGMLGRNAEQEAVTPEVLKKRREKVVDALLARLGVKRTGLTYVIAISVTTTTPEKSQLIANTYADRYLLEQLESKFEATQAANTWLSQRLGELRGQVLAAEAAVAQYRIANNLMSTSGASLTEQEISTYNQQVALAKAQEAEDLARLRTAQEQLARGSSGDDVGEALGSEVVKSLRNRRAEVSGRVADLEGRYGARHPEMLKAQRELADIDAQIEAEIRRIISNLQARVQVSAQRAASIQNSLSGARGALASNNQATVRLNELERNAESVRVLYESFLNRFKETTAQQGIEQSDARVVSRAKLPTKPSEPNTTLNLAVGLVFALGAAVGAVILAEALDTGLATADDVERRLEAPYLGSVHLLSSVAEERNPSPPVEYVVRKPLSSFAESFRALRTAVRFARVGSQTKVLVVTSSLPGEGKTTTSVCLARSAAQAGDRVLIIDCDLRRRNINKLMGIEAETGLIEVLNGEASLDSALLQDQESGAYILPLAKSSFTPKDVFGSAAMDRLLMTVREHFDLVILDTAPALAVADTRQLAAKADAVVVLARWRKTPQKAVEATLKLLAGSRGNVAGVALTQVNMKAQSRYGYGDPGYYYGEYKKYYTS